MAIRWDWEEDYCGYLEFPVEVKGEGEIPNIVRLYRGNAFLFGLFEIFSDFFVRNLLVAFARNALYFYFVSFVYVNNKVFNVLHHCVGLFGDSYLHVVKAFVVVMFGDDVFGFGQNVFSYLGSGNYFDFVVQIFLFAGTYTFI